MGGLNVACRIKKNPAMSHVFVARERALSLVAYHKLSHVTDDFYPHVACQVKKIKLSFVPSMLLSPAEKSLCQISKNGRVACRF